MKETVRELISEEKLMKRIDELAEKINKDYQGTQQADSEKRNTSPTLII